MKPILIKKDEAKIIEAKKSLDAGVSNFQLVYNLFAERNIDLNLSEIRLLLFTNWSQAPANHIKEFMTDKIISKMEAPAIGGIPIRKGKLREFVDLGSIKDVEDEVKRIAFEMTNHSSIDISMLQIVDGVISKVDDSDQKTEAKFSYYTQNKRGVELVERIRQTIQLLEEYRQFLGKDENGELFSPGCFKLPGIQFTGSLEMGIKEGDLIIDLAYIRRMEAIYEKRS